MSEQETINIVRTDGIGQEYCRVFINGKWEAATAALLDCLQERTKEDAGGRLRTGTTEEGVWVVKQQYARWFSALLPLWQLMQQKEPAVAAIDGRCGSGKTTLAELAEKVFDCRVFHMDDYYLPMEQREPDWEQIPAGNMDLERLRNQVLKPVRLGQSVQYIPYSCRAGCYGPAQQIAPADLTIIEGSYSQHPQLTEYYDMTLFLTCTPEEQTAWLQQREGNFFKMFRKRWIPMEEAYFTSCDVPKRADVQFDTTAFCVREIG